MSEAAEWSVAGKYHFRKLRPEYLKRQSRKKRIRTQPACKILLRWISSSELNYPNDCETVLQPCKHSCSRFSAYFRVKAEKALDALFAFCTFRVSHHHRGGRVVAEDTLKKTFLCSCCSEISILAAEKTEDIGELCTCGNLPHTCQEGQHTHGKQKLLYLSYTQTRVMLPHSTTTEPTKRPQHCV